MHRRQFHAVAKALPHFFIQARLNPYRMIQLVALVNWSLTPRHFFGQRPPDFDIDKDYYKIMGISEKATE